MLFCNLVSAKISEFRQQLIQAEVNSELDEMVEALDNKFDDIGSWHWTRFQGTEPYRKLKRQLAVYLRRIGVKPSGVPCFYFANEWLDNWFAES